MSDATRTAAPDYVPAVIPDIDVASALHPVAVPVTPAAVNQPVEVVPVEPEVTTVTADFAGYEKKVKNYFLGIWRVLTTVFFVLSVGMFIIGCIYVNKCPGGKFITVYLITSGVIGSILFALMIGECCREKPKNGILTDNSYKLYAVAAFLFALFIGWTFFGSVPILLTDVQTGEPRRELYCHKVPFSVSFYTGAVLDILYIILFVVGFSVLCARGTLKPKTYDPSK